jgi:hypothetical protein
MFHLPGLLLSALVQQQIQFPDQLGSMTEQFKKIADAIEQINFEKAKVQVTSSLQSHNVEQIFYNIKCSNDLYMLKHLKINIQLDLIPCIPCSNFKKQESKHLLNAIKSSFSMFEYNEQDQHQLQSQRFRNLQQSSKVHCSNKLHISCVEQDDKLK